MSSCSVVCCCHSLVVKISHSLISSTSSLTHSFNCPSFRPCAFWQWQSFSSRHCGVFACKEAKKCIRFVPLSTKNGLYKDIKGLGDVKMAWSWKVNGGGACVASAISQCVVESTNEDNLLWEQGRWLSDKRNACFLLTTCTIPEHLCNLCDDIIITWPVDCMGWMEYRCPASLWTTGGQHQSSSSVMNCSCPS